MLNFPIGEHPPTSFRPGSTQCGSVDGEPPRLLERLSNLTLHGPAPPNCRPATAEGRGHQLWRGDPYSAFVSSISTTLVAPVIGTITPGDFIVSLSPSTRMK